MLGEEPVFVLNSDYVWVQDGEPALETLVRLWDPDRMDALLTVAPKDRTLGFDTPGDFFRDSAGRLSHRGGAPEAPLHAFGVEILDPRRVYEEADEAFSLFRTWMRAQSAGRLYGFEPGGLWTQVGDPGSLQIVEARLKAPVP